MTDLPRPPWYDTIERTLAPTERAATIGLLVFVAVTLVIAWRGSATAKALWLVYVVSP
jgi:hypothetical protein